MKRIIATIILVFIMLFQTTAQTNIYNGSLDERIIGKLDSIVSKVKGFESKFENPNQYLEFINKFENKLLEIEKKYKYNKIALEMVGYLNNQVSVIKKNVNDSIGENNFDNIFDELSNFVNKETDLKKEGEVNVGKYVCELLQTNNSGVGQSKWSFGVTSTIEECRSLCDGSDMKYKLSCQWNGDLAKNYEKTGSASAGCPTIIIGGKSIFKGIHGQVRDLELSRSKISGGELIVTQKFKCDQSSSNWLKTGNPTETLVCYGSYINNGKSCLKREVIKGGCPATTIGGISIPQGLHGQVRALEISKSAISGGELKVMQEFKCDDSSPEWYRRGDTYQEVVCTSGYTRSGTSCVKPNTGSGGVISGGCPATTIDGASIPQGTHGQTKDVEMSKSTIIGGELKVMQEFKCDASSPNWYMRGNIYQEAVCTSGYTRSGTSCVKTNTGSGGVISGGCSATTIDGINIPQGTHGQTKDVEMSKITIIGGEMKVMQTFRCDKSRPNWYKRGSVIPEVICTSGYTRSGTSCVKTN